MWWIDLIFFGILILGALVGVWQGFFKCLFSVFGFAGCCAVAYLLKDAVSGLLESWFNLGTILSNFITEKLSAIYQPFAGTVLPKDELVSVINESPLHVFFKKILESVIGSSGTQDPATVCELVSPTLSNWILIAISIVSIFIIVRFLILIFSLVFRKLFKDTGVSVVNRVLGGGFGLVKGSMYVLILTIILTLLCAIPGIGGTVTPAIENTFVYKYIFRWVASRFGIVWI